MEKLLGLKDGDVVSIVGSGGKTSTMLYLAEKLKQTNQKILVTTTTKILKPKLGIDFFAAGETEFTNLAKRNSTGVYVGAKEIMAGGKLIGFAPEYLDDCVDNFAISFIESDGSKRKSLKGWRAHEPVIIKKTSITLGVLNLALLGQAAHEALIHNLPEFCMLTGAKPGEKITLAHLKSMILHEKGLFKDARGKRVIFVNQVEDAKTKKQAESLIALFNEEELKLLDQVVMGSIHNKRFECIFRAH